MTASDPTAAATDRPAGGCCGGSKAESVAPGKPTASPRPDLVQLTDLPPLRGNAAPKAIDPVCGMSVDTRAGKPQFSYQGTTYHFCCNGCRTKFEADPETYLAKQRQAVTTTSSCCGGAEAEAPQPTSAASCCGGAKAKTSEPTEASSCCGGTKDATSQPAQTESCCGGHDHAGQRYRSEEADLEIGPVCGMRRRVLGAAAA